MKKIFLSFVFILAGIITIFAQSVYQDPNRTPIGSNKTVLGFFTSSPPIIDGILDDDCWTMAPGAVGATSGGAGYNAGSTSFPSQPVQMRINLMDNGVNAPSFPPSNTFPTASYPTSAGSFGTSWDKDYLYFAIYVIDVEIANATIITGDYYGISLYLNNGNGTSGATTKLANDYPSLLEISGRDVQLALGYVPVGTAAEYPLIGDPGISVPQGIGIQNYPGSYKIAVKKMFNGYIYEGKISWKVLNKEFYKESDGSWDVSKGNESQWAPDAAGFTGSGRPPLRIDVGIDLYGTQKANPRGQMMWNQCCYNINWSRTQFYGYMSLQGAIVDVVCPSSITVSVSSVNISTPNGTATAKATVNAGATKEIAWGVLGTTSGGFPLAIIDKNTGVVTALNNGTVTVMAKSDNKTCASIASTSGVNGTASITISNQVAPTGFNIAGAGIASNWGTSTLSTTAIPANAPNYVTWSIEPASNLATINSITGVLEATALGSGTVTVKATSIANGVFSTRVINISTPAVISCFGINAYTKINQCNRPSKFIATVGGLSIGDQINLLAQYYDPALAFAGEIPASLMNYSLLTVPGSGNYKLTKTARDWILTFGQITGRLTVWAPILIKQIV